MYKNVSWKTKKSFKIGLKKGINIFLKEKEYGCQRYSDLPESEKKARVWS